MTQTKRQGMSHIDAKAEEYPSGCSFTADGEHVPFENSKCIYCDNKGRTVIEPTDAKAEQKTNLVLDKTKEFLPLVVLAAKIEECDKRGEKQDDWNLRHYRTLSRPAVILRMWDLICESRNERDEPKPRPHARINCNGKSCGEFNCDTCHPVEGEPRLAANCMDCGLDYDWHGCDIHLPLSDWLQIVPSGSGLLCGTCIARRVNKLPGVTGITAYINRGAIENDGNVSELLAELAALKATPQNTAQRINSLWTGKELLPCECPAFQEYVYYNSETKHCHCVKCGDVYTHESQDSSSLPLEDPDQLVSDERLAELAGLEEMLSEECTESAEIDSMVAELQQWRALAARRGGK